MPASKTKLDEMRNRRCLRELTGITELLDLAKKCGNEKAQDALRARALDLVRQVIAEGLSGKHQDRAQLRKGE